MSKLKAFNKKYDVTKKKSNKSTWIVLSAFILVITIVVFRTYAKYIFTNEEIDISSTQVDNFYYEELLNGSYPVVSDELVPITIDNAGTVYKADLGSEWYKYEDKRWANAVVLKSNEEIIGKDNISGAIINSNNVYFDGVDDYINVGLNKQEFNTNISIAVTFKFNSFVSNGTNGVIGNWDRSGAGIYYSGGKLVGCVYIKENDKYANVSISFNDISNYHTAVMTYDGSTLKLFLDGKLVSSNSVVGTITTSNVPFLLGANPNNNSEGGFDLIELANVNIKEYAIYSTTLSDTEVIDNMSNRVGITNTNGLLSYGNYTGSFVNNSIIPENHIESYFVWIPKYSYQLWDLGEYSSATSIDSTKPHSIGIRFGTTNTSDGVLGECSTPGVAGSSGNCSVGDYMTHPAFLAFDTNGLWVGKFETGYDGATTTAEAQVNEIDVSKVIIKPNVYSWRSLTVGNMFKNSYDYIRDDNSHMMKSTEWGAIAYLSHSLYGTCDETNGNETCTEIRMNNNSSSITGYSSSENHTLGNNNGISIEGNRVDATSLEEDGLYTLNYLNNNSVLSSTTLNYTGIYDMSGGSWEYVMGYTTESDTVGGLSEITTIYPDFYSNNIYEKYYDKYSNTVIYDYTDRILGDATGEMGPFGVEKDPDDGLRYKSSWYRCMTSPLNPSSPWYAYGGYYNNGSNSGLFAFFGMAGSTFDFYSFRIVLSPKN